MPSHAEIAAAARKPYADKIMRDQRTIATLREALVEVLDTLAVYRGNQTPRCLDHIEATVLLALAEAQGV